MQLTIQLPASIRSPRLLADLVCRPTAMVRVDRNSVEIRLNGRAGCVVLQITLH